MSLPFNAGAAITAAALDQLPVYSFLAAGQSVTSTSPAPVSPMAVPVLSGQTWRVHGLITCTQGATAAQQNFRFAGPAVSDGLVAFWSFNVSSSSGLGAQSLAGIGTGFFSTPAWAIGAVFFVGFDGAFTFSAGGTLELVAANATSGDTFSVTAGSVADFWQSPP